MIDFELEAMKWIGSCRKATRYTHISAPSELAAFHRYMQESARFISVQDAMPPVNSPVLVPLWNCKHKYGIALWDGADWWIANEERMPKYAPLSHISHWLELPTLPEFNPNT